jgi:uncharacterized membrane protein HdeD (DUF308 family)
MAAKKRSISVWYFIGWLILVYGILILVAGFGGASTQPPPVMSELHVAIWWGAFLTVIGSAYVYCFRPGRR